MDHIILPDSVERPLTFYLSMEEYVAAAYGCGFFVWRVAPTVIIGRNQDLETEVNVPFCMQHGINVVRRKSGGGCVYADRGNLMLSYITPQKGVDLVFREFLDKFAAALCGLGLPAVCTAHNDILVDGCKVSGNAFFSLPKGSIVHGTLLHSVDFEMLSQAITPTKDKLEKHGIQSVRQRVANLTSLGLDLSMDELADYLIHAFCDGERCLDGTDIEGINDLEKRYKNPIFDELWTKN